MPVEVNLNFPKMYKDHNSLMMWIALKNSSEEIKKLEQKKVLRKDERKIFSQGDIKIFSSNCVFIWYLDYFGHRILKLYKGEKLTAGKELIVEKWRCEWNTTVYKLYSY